MISLKVLGHPKPVGHSIDLMKVKPWLMSTALNNVQPIQTTAKVMIRRNGMSHFVLTSFIPVKRSMIKKLPWKTPHAMNVQLAPCHKPVNKNTQAKLM